MKTLFMGSCHLVNQALYTIVDGLKDDYSSYIGVGGSSVIAAVLACKLTKEETRILFSSLRLVANEYGWNEKACLSMFNDVLPRGNSEPYKQVLKRAFGIKKLSEVPLGVVAYSLSSRRFDLIRGENLTVVEAIIIATSLPGYFYPTYYNRQQYIDATPINRYPIDVIPEEEDVYGIYIQSSSKNFGEEILSAASKPWQQIIPSFTLKLPDYDN